MVVVTSMGLTLGLISMLSSISLSFKNSEYNGVLSYDTNINMNEIIEVTLPTEFKTSFTQKDYNYKYEYNSKDSSGFTKCEFEINAVSDYKNSNKLITEMAKYNEATNTISKSKINGTVWDTFQTDNSMGRSYYYATFKKNNVYIMIYEIGKDADTDKCNKYKDEIIKTVKFK